MSDRHVELAALSAIAHARLAVLEVFSTRELVEIQELLRQQAGAAGEELAWIGADELASLGSHV